MLSFGSLGYTASDKGRLLPMKINSIKEYKGTKLLSYWTLYLYSSDILTLAIEHFMKAK